MKTDLNITIVYNVNIGTKYNRTVETNYVAAIFVNMEYINTLYLYDSTYNDLTDKALNLVLTYLDKEKDYFSTINYNEINLEYNNN